VGEGGKLVDETGRIIAEVVAAVGEVTQRIAQIAVASQEQSTGVGEINKSLAQLEEMTQQNAAMVEQASAASEAFEEEAAKVEKTVQAFGGATAPRPAPRAGAGPVAASPVKRRVSGTRNLPAKPRYRPLDDAEEWKEF